MRELTAALRLAPPRVAAELVDRFRSQAEEILADHSGIPRHAAAKILAQGGFDLAGYLNDTTDDSATDLYLRAARLGDPRTSTDLFQMRDRIAASVLDEVVAHIADPDDPEWHTDRGLVHLLRMVARVDPVEAMRWPFAVLTRQVAAAGCRLYPFAVAIDMCVAVAVRGGRDALRDLANHDLGHPGLADMVRAAANVESPTAYLAERRPPGEWTDRAAVRALGAVRHNTSKVSPEDVPPLDWDAVLREHERLPFDRNPMAWVTGWAGCPEELVREAFAVNVSGTVEHAAALPFDLLTSAKLLDEEQWYFTKGVRRWVANGSLDTARMFKEVPRAGLVLASLPYGEPGVAEAVAELLAPLGTDAGNWLTFYARLARYTGTAAEFVAEVASGTGKRSVRWPRPLEPAWPATHAENTRETLLAVLQCMPDDVLVALAPHLDLRAVQHQLVFGNPSDRVRDALLEAHGPAGYAAFGATARHTPEVREWLLDQDVPECDAALFLHGNISMKERVRLLDGTRRDGTRGPVPQPMLDALETVNLGHYRAHVVAGLPSGDAGVARVIAERLRLGTEGGRLRLLIALWEREGADAVGPVLDLERMPVKTVKTVREALAEPDGLDRLRALLAVEDAPENVLKRLRKRADDPEALVRKVAGEGLPMPWTELAEAADEGLLTPVMVAALADRKDCSREFALAAVRATVGHGHATWHRLDSLLYRKTLTPVDVLLEAPEVSRFLNDLAIDRRYYSRRTWSEPCAEARELTERHLGGDTDAWAVAIHLFDSFHGTFPELLATASAASA
ncbi:hypothetical protein [Yinghuangia seranimata]|uniref:hypothetical protein n=1 Tax=Yinghuangia seranimata TaxID=408067 RepID=UPI00248BFAF2|nr:hypothetical protein [Yinghuangia seranimata]MDI2125829.1 hypothetical protein [Yinghuangia seranimata]